MIVSSGFTVPVAVTVRVTLPRLTGAVMYRTVVPPRVPHHASPAVPARRSIAVTSQGPRRCFEARAVGGKRCTPVPGAALCVCIWFMGRKTDEPDAAACNLNLRPIAVGPGFGRG